MLSSTEPCIRGWRAALRRVITSMGARKLPCEGSVKIISPLVRPGSCSPAGSRQEKLASFLENSYSFTTTEVVWGIMWSLSFTVGMPHTVEQAHLDCLKRYMQNFSALIFKDKQLCLWSPVRGQSLCEWNSSSANYLWLLPKWLACIHVSNWAHTHT